MVKRFRKNRRPKRPFRRMKKRPMKRLANFKTGTLVNPIKGNFILPRRLVTTCVSKITGYINTFPATIIGGIPGRAQSFYNVMLNANYPWFPFIKSFGAQGDADIFILDSTASYTTAIVQPQGFQALVGLGNQFYSNYRVYGVKVTMNGLPNGAADDSFIAMAPIASQGATAIYADQQAFASAQGGIGPKLINYYGAVSGTKISKYWSIADVVGSSKQNIKDNPNYAGNANTGPNSRVFIQCGMWTADNSVFNSNPTFQISVRFYLELFNPNESSLTV